MISHFLIRLTYFLDHVHLLQMVVVLSARAVAHRKRQERGVSRLTPWDMATIMDHKYAPLMKSFISHTPLGPMT